MRRLAEFVAALTLLTRLPAARLVRGQDWPEAAACVWAYPIVGGLIGGVAGAVIWLAERSGLSPGLAATLGLAAMLLLTGAMHEDGLADTADGFGGGTTAAQKLEIMRDSRIGSFGALALMVAMALRVLALASLPAAGAAAAAVAAGGLGRGAIIVQLLMLRPARGDGVAASLRSVRLGAAFAGLLLAAACTALLPLTAAASCIAGAVFAAVCVSILARRHVGGHTGDALGAAEVIAECVILCIASARA